VQDDVSGAALNAIGAEGGVNTIGGSEHTGQAFDHG